MRAIFDSNILVDFLNKQEKAKTVFDDYEEKYISAITYIEILAGTRDPVEEMGTKAFLSNFKVVFTDHQILSEIISLKKSFKLILNDALLVAIGITNNIPIVSRNESLRNLPNIKIPYTI